VEHKYSQMTNALCGTFKPFVNQEAQAQFDAIKKHYFSRFHKEDADEIAQPMREMFRQILEGELYEIDGVLMMEIPENKSWECVGDAELIPIHESISGWIDCWRRIDRKMSFYSMGVLAKQIEAGRCVTESMARKAEAEFEASIDRLMHIDKEVILQAVSTTQIRIYMKKLEIAK